MIDALNIDQLSAAAREVIDGARSGLKICLVKQTTYPDLYLTPKDASAAETIFSSTLRSGPVGLFTCFDTDFVIVDVAEDVECSIWKEKVYHCEHGPEELFLSFKTRPYVMGKVGSGAFAQNVDDIDWSEYDIVISLDIAIPRRIVDSHKSVLWAYYVTEGCMGSYNVSTWKLIAGYDCFLNMAFRLDSATAAHEINAPYHLHYFGCFSDLDQGLFTPDVSRTGVVLDTTSMRNAPPEIIQRISNLVGVNECGGDIRNHLAGMCKSKYYLRVGGGAKQGNSIPEAVSAGCLYLANRGEFNNADLFTDDTYVDSWESAIAAIERFEADDELFQANLRKQRAHIDYTCFLRPMAELIQRLQLKRAA
jgi:hypothetical protein